ncbi:MULTISPECIES: electron transport complex subunit RsxC [Thermotoga]|uniref:Ion-translocating oxidoreductase complex subunit C n=1 Tax=Thermotoga neapolitana (strain ATCC 49049 / DSM 4359 / NBRC 107923 / NS-E) TaxID=309803 RepID=B9K6N5_THENN|nr:MULTISPECIES: electron transport complex subunit RsxC [Thermotoga]ACM22618.1 Electron transport complex protein [Thermotoga neapolitana DSM 4359]AJG40565.1 electron transporter RnfC [Thermotoga sp. RQ7]KFZ22257.1 RnfABCDGE type electron transport complex subunit C [Thermotoga neapolitana LA10]HBF11049.1 electron transport complex subunit RsxC [Thermotoga neapolitana]
MLTFKGGVHPPQLKDWTKEKPIEKMPLPQKVYVFLLNHAGSPSKALVSPGDEVKTGQIIGEPDGFISAYLHSPVTGKVIEIKKILHPVAGKPVEAVVIERTSDDEWVRLETGDFERMSKEEILDVIKKAGVVGLGGAMFPTHVKLSPPPEKKIDTLIINGAECEPVLTIDHRMMLERAEDILQGILIMMKVLGVQKAVVGVENNKMDAYNHLKKVFKGYPVDVALLKTKYPQGAEKQLIYAITRRKVPRGGLPMDVGVVVQNVGTCVAVKEAVVDGKPLVERGMTVSGDAVRDPKNLIVRIGTPVKDVLEYCGGIDERTERVILGGPMMGISITSLDTPVMKGTSGITAFLPRKPQSQKPCIRCSECVQVCPMNLQPYLLYLLSTKRKYDEAVENGLMDCIECGSCTYTCPSKIEHVRYIKLAKTVYRATRRGRK